MSSSATAVRGAPSQRARHVRTPRADRVNWEVATPLLAAFVAFVAPARLELINGVDVGLLVGLALSPIWLPTLTRFRWARAILVIGLLALGSGILLTFLDPGGREFDRALMQGETGLVLTCLVGFGVVLWAREVLGIGWASVWFGLGYVVAGVLHPTDLGSPWKYDFGIPVTLIVLGLAATRGRPRPLLEVPLALLMAGLFAVNDSRSIFGIVVVAALACAVQAFLPRGTGRIRDTLLPVGVLALVGFGVYRLAMWAIEAGLLGEAARTRTLAQAELSGGNLLAGGRPEMGASMRLIAAEPLGYGNGLMANYDDYAAATLGMADVSGRLPDPGYVQEYMLGYGFTLHSTLAEFWVRYGLFGLVFVLLVAGVTIAGMLRLLAQRSLTVLVAFASLNTLWNLLFSPTTDTLYAAALSLAIVLAPVGADRHAVLGDDADPGPEAEPAPGSEADGDVRPSGGAEVAATRA